MYRYLYIQALDGIKKVAHRNVLFEKRIYCVNTNSCQKNKIKTNCVICTYNYVHTLYINYLNLRMKYAYFYKCSIFLILFLIIFIAI